VRFPVFSPFSTFLYSMAFAYVLLGSDTFSRKLSFYQRFSLPKVAAIGRCICENSAFISVLACRQSAALNRTLYGPKLSSYLLFRMSLFQRS
jgi:hypothetical protein